MILGSNICHGLCVPGGITVIYGRVAHSGLFCIELNIIDVVLTSQTMISNDLSIAPGISYWPNRAIETNTLSNDSVVCFMKTNEVYYVFVEVHLPA